MSLPFYSHGKTRKIRFYRESVNRSSHSQLSRDLYNGRGRQLRRLNFEPRERLFRAIPLTGRGFRAARDHRCLDDQSGHALARLFFNERGIERIDASIRAALLLCRNVSGNRDRRSRRNSGSGIRGGGGGGVDVGHITLLSDYNQVVIF